MSVTSRTILLGYHGTDRKFAFEIKRTKEFIISSREGEWLGDGIYFFENDKDEALDWARFNRNYPDPIVLFCEINPQKLLDLTLKRHQQEISRIILAIQDRYKREEKTPEIQDRNIINLLCHSEGYDVVRGMFVLRSSVFSKLHGFTRLTRSHIQICVRKNENINWDSIKGWDEHGEEIF